MPNNGRRADSIDTFFDELHRADALLDRAQGVLGDPSDTDFVLQRYADSPRAKRARPKTRFRPRHSAPGAPSSGLRQVAFRTRLWRSLRLVMLFVGSAALACGALLLWGAERTGDLRLTALALAILLAAQSLWVATAAAGFRHQTPNRDRGRRGDRLTVNRSRAPVILKR